jgi:hypothetical protein
MNRYTFAQWVVYTSAMNGSGPQRERDNHEKSCYYRTNKYAETVGGLQYRYIEVRVILCVQT